MKLLRRKDDRLELQLGQREMSCFMDLIELYPCVPPAHQTLTRHPDKQIKAARENQALLDEALAAHREEQRKNILCFVNDPARCRTTARGGVLRLTPGDAEWLLQVLNDIRVGSWIRLGSPEECNPPATPKNMHDVWAMETSGYFQGALLEVLGPGD